MAESESVMTWLNFHNARYILLQGKKNNSSWPQSSTKNKDAALPTRVYWIARCVRRNNGIKQHKDLNIMSKIKHGRVASHCGVCVAFRRSGPT